MGRAARAATAAVLLGATGCGAGAEQPPGLVKMTPAVANNDLPLAALIYGDSFRPSYVFDPVSGNTGVEVNGFSAQLSQITSPSPTAVLSHVPLSEVLWEAENMLSAVLPAGIAPGLYDLVVHDPRGQSSRLPGAFDSLGPDLIPPVVTIVSPVDDSVVGGQAQVPVVVLVDDGIGQVVSLQVSVRTGSGSSQRFDCSAAAQAKTDCTFSFTAPTPTSNLAALFIDATATDGGGNTGTAETALKLVPGPLATSLSPSSGSTSSVTVVTVFGANFVAGATNVMFDGVVAEQVSPAIPTSVTVFTPPHLAGQVAVTVEVGGARATVPGGFLYVDPPVVRAISPSYGPVAGGTAVRIVGDNFKPSTQILLDGVPLLSSTFDNANLIEGLTPPGTGAAAVGTYDPDLDVTTGGMVLFYYGADGGTPPDPTYDGGVPIPCLVDAGCAGSGP